MTIGLTLKLHDRAPLGVGFDIATDAWEDAVIGNGGTVSAEQKALVNDLILSLKYDGIWEKLDRFWLYAGENAEAAVIDLVEGAEAILGNAPAFAANGGFTGASTKYISANYNPQVELGNYVTEGPACWFVWNNTNTPNAGAILGSSPELNQYTRAWLPYTDNTVYWRLNFGDGDGTCDVDGNGLGLWVATSEDLSAGSDLYRNGVLLKSEAAHPGGDPTNFYNLANQPVGGDYFTGQLSVFGFGAALTSAQQAALYRRLRVYMEELGNDVPPIDLETETTDWVRFVAGDGGTVSYERQLIINDLVVGLKEDGVWDSLDDLQIWAAENEAQACRGIKSLGHTVLNGTPVFTADVGYVTSTDNYVTSSNQPETATHYTQNSAHHFYWRHNAGDAPGGDVNYSNRSQIYPKLTADGLTYWKLNRNSGGYNTFAGPGTDGFYLANRSAANLSTLRINGNLEATDTVASESIAAGLYQYGYAGGGEFGGGTISAIGYGGSLTEEQQQMLYERVAACLEAIGTFDNVTTLDPAFTNADITLSGGNLIATAGGAVSGCTRATVGKRTGKYYCEFTIGASGTPMGLGFCNSTYAVAEDGRYLGDDLNSLGWYYTGTFYINGSIIGTIQNYTNNDVLALSMDLDNSKFWLRNVTVGGQWNGVLNGNPADGGGFLSLAALTAGTFFPAAIGELAGSGTFNFGATPYVGTPPEGFGNWIDV